MGTTVEIAFVEESSRQWNDEAARECAASLLPVGSLTPSSLSVSGCPACGHSTYDVLPLEIVATASSNFVLRGAAERSEEVMRLENILGRAESTTSVFHATAVQCNCSVAHPGAGKRSGCGRFWSLEVARSGEVRPVDAVPTTLDLARTRALKVWSSDELPNVRKTATAWQAGFAGLIALVSTVLFIKGPESVQDLSNAARVPVLALLGLALLLAIFASVFALLAANGLPQNRPADQLDPQVSPHDEAVNAANRLKVSILAAVVATILLAAAVGVSWFGASEPGQGVMLEFTGSADPVCGSLMDSSDSGSLTLRVSNGDIRSFRLSGIATVASADECS